MVQPNNHETQHTLTTIRLFIVSIPGLRCRIACTLLFRLVLVRIGGYVCGSCDWTVRSYSPFFCRAHTGWGCSAKRGAATAVSYGCGSECALRDGRSASGMLSVPDLKWETPSCERYVPGSLLRSHCQALPFGIGSLFGRIDWLHSREETDSGTLICLISRSLSSQ